MSEATAWPAASEAVLDALRIAGDLCRRYQISALDDFLETCGAFAAEKTLNVAIFGRFKAGKSSFLNHLLARPLLPVGAVPVTTVVTDIEFAPHERAEVVFKDGHTEQIELERIGEFASESGNPENSKKVVRVRVQVPAMERYPGARFVDTPGLESVLEHNTEAALEWLPNVGLAIVAVGVDPPLSRNDIELIRNLSRYTPNISLLLTKVDVMEKGERAEVEEFVRKQLARYRTSDVPVFPYSIRPGFEHLRAEIHENLLARAHSEAGEQRAAILRHKVDSLLDECAEYLTVALKAAETVDSERAQLCQSIIGQKEYLDDTRQALRLIARQAAGTCRATFERILQQEEQPLRERLLTALDQEFPAWARSLSVAAERFEDWLGGCMTRDMTALSSKHRAEFLEPLGRVRRQLSQSLEDFRNRLSERALKALGVPLHTSEMEFHAEDPRSPDVRVGKIFDRSWELLSFLLPMPLIRGVLRKHFQRKVADVVFVNLSRLASQWEEIVKASLSALEKEGADRLARLITTIEKLVASAGQEAPQIRADLAKLEEMRGRLRSAGF